MRFGAKINALPARRFSGRLQSAGGEELRPIFVSPSGVDAAGAKKGN